MAKIYIRKYGFEKKYFTHTHSGNIEFAQFKAVPSSSNLTNNNNNNLKTRHNVFFSDRCLNRYSRTSHCYGNHGSGT